MIAASSLALGLMVVYISFVDVLSSWLGGHTLVTFILILLRLLRCEVLWPGGADELFA